MLAQDYEPKRRRDAGILQTTERDIMALSWIAEQFTISFDHLQILLGRNPKAKTKAAGILSPSATRNALLRWTQLGLIEEPRKVIREHPPYIWLSRRGLTQLGLAYPYYKPQISTVKHIYAINTIRLHLEGYELQSTWHSLRSLARETTEHPKPDGELRLIGQSHIAVKIIEQPLKYDISLRDEIATLETLAKRYTSLWYFIHADAIPLMQHALTKIDQQIQQKVTFYGLDARPAAEDQAH